MSLLVLTLIGVGDVKDCRDVSCQQPRLMRPRLGSGISDARGNRNPVLTKHQTPTFEGRYIKLRLAMQLKTIKAAVRVSNGSPAA